VRSNKRFFIGIDGGGTKTTAAICTEQGHIVGSATADSSNILSRPWGEVEQTLRQLIDEVIEQAGAHRDEIETLLFGLAGADRPQVKQLILTAFEYDFLDRIEVDSDAIPALYSGTWGGPGVVLISGTGSISYGLTTSGKRYRVGGWGYLVGDEGSGYDLGAQAVRAVLREFDGRGVRTMLTELLMAHFAINRVEELIQRLYGAANPRKELAEVSVLVERAAERGDEVALSLVQKAADALIELAVTCLEKTKEPLPVVLAGGLLASDTLLRRKVLAASSFTGVIPIVPPVVGSLVLALQRAGIGVTETQQENLTESWKGRGEANGE
jgi:N-acetylglucosamine kinase-like BadF-type ATPase